MAATVAIGTAQGDLTATTFGLGYLASAFLFAGIIAVPAIGWSKFNRNPVFSFWFAYVVTRPSVPRSPTGWASPGAPAGWGGAAGPSPSGWPWHLLSRRLAGRHPCRCPGP